MLIFVVRLELRSTGDDRMENQWVKLCSLFLYWRGTARDRQIGKRYFETNAPRGAPDEFHAFTFLKLPSRFHTILYQPWKDQITCKYLWLLASSTPLERDMSKMWVIFNRRRLRMKGKLLNMLGFFLEWKLMLSMRIKYSFYVVIDFWQWSQLSNGWLDT